jgi:cell division protein FtsQ
MWILLTCGAIVLLVAGVRKKDTQLCKEVDINIHGVQNNFFIDEKDVLASITSIAGTNPVGKAIGSFDLRKMETELEKNIWIKKSELFFDNNNVLKVNVQEREPVARIFTSAGSTFYIDNTCMRLPLSDKFSARLPVFTGFPTDNIILSKEDSILLNDIKSISLSIQKDSFRMALIEQIDITPQRNFEMVPKIGNQLIVFGDASNAEEKFESLKLFYKNVLAKAGYNYYSNINVQYQGQIVAKRRGAEDVTTDSLRTLQIMQLIAERAEQQSSDSLQTIIQDNSNNTADSSMIQQSIQRDETNELSNTIEKPQPQENATIVKPIIQNPKPKPATNNSPKPKPVKPNPVKTNLPKPRVTMPVRNNN